MAVVAVFSALAATSLVTVFRRGLTDDDFPFVVAALAAEVATVFLIRASGSMIPSYRRSWRFIAAAVAVGGLMEVLAAIADGAQGTLWAALGRVLPLAAGGLGLAGLLGLSKRRGPRTRLVTLSLDAAVTALAGLTIAWLVFEPQRALASQAGSALLMTLAATTLVALVLLRLTQVPRSWFGPMAMLAASGTLTLPAALLPSPPVAPGLPAFFWIAACGTIAMAPLGGTWNQQDDSVEPLLVQRFLPYLAAIAAMLAVILAHVTGRDIPRPIPGLVVSIALALATRQLVGALDERKHSTELLYQATHDPLTQVANRSVLLARLDLLLRRSADPLRAHALLFLDLDEFKFVNDGISHGVGDAVIQEVASRLQRALRPTDLIARLGGDEFALLLENRRIRDVRAICGRLLTQVYKPHFVQGHELRVSCSIGVALLEKTDSSASLLRKADAAMYAAKRAGKNSWRFWDIEMHTEAESALHLLQDLEQTVARGDLRLVFQPIVNLASGQLFGAEALLRWLRPGEGWVSIGPAIPALEGSRLLVTIDDWVLRQACRQVKTWREQGWAARVGINVSAAEIADSTYPARFARIVHEEGAQPSWLAIEVTEGMALGASRAARHALQALRALGVRVSIDDFGTAYSSLRRLREFGFDSLKIDASFVADPTERGRKLLGAMVTIGQSIGVTVIAEGIESPEQAELLRSFGCHLGQGFHMCPPVSPDELERRFVDVGIEVPKPPRMAVKAAAAVTLGLSGKTAVAAAESS